MSRDRDYDDRDRHSMGGRDADLVLAPGEYAYVQDGTKGNVTVFVGPHKTTISQTDQPVNWDRKSRRFKPCSQHEAVHACPAADEGSYIVLEDPAKENKHPSAGTSNPHTDLNVGRKVNIPGPASFPLWPGQSATEIQGHRLRSNEYLIVRVLNSNEAIENWGAAVVQPQKDTTHEATSQTSEDGDESNPENGGETPTVSPTTEGMTMMPTADRPEDLVMGQLIVVPGNRVSFFIPPTGIEVVRDSHDRYVRKAVTLENLEYCILLDESGEKRFIKGPAVVFPSPTETFEEDARGNNKFLAKELNHISGVYVKVIADYTEDDGTKRNKGEELFITGKEQAIYYPRPEHAILKYGDQQIHYAVVVPEGEARHVLNRETGNIRLAKGPDMLLPDPRKEVIVRRILSPQQVELWFPENAEAMIVNRALREAQASDADFLTARDAADIDYASYAEDRRGGERLEAMALTRRSSREGSATRSIEGESLTRRTTFTPPDTVTVNSTYEGAVRIDVWPSFAVMVVDKTGKRRAVVGPESTLLEFGESLVAMTLSTGRPKTDDNPIRTPYMKVRHNTVSDVVKVETNDLFNARIPLSYRVNFIGEDPEKWFEVDNYVKFLTDHLRSILRHRIKQCGVEEFYANATSIVRDCILGVASEDGTERPGKLFEENGMHVYDVEVGDVEIDHEIFNLLSAAKREQVEGELQVANDERRYELKKRQEAVVRKLLEEADKTAQAQHESKLATSRQRLAEALANIKIQIESDQTELAAQLANQESLDAIASAELERRSAIDEQSLSVARQTEEIATKATVERMEAMSEELVAALQAFGDKHLAGQALESMAPLAMLGGGSVAEVVNRMLTGTAFQDVLTPKKDD